MIKRLLGIKKWESGIAVMEDNVLGNRVMAFRFPLQDEVSKEFAEERSNKIMQEVKIASNMISLLEYE